MNDVISIVDNTGQIIIVQHRAIQDTSAGTRPAGENVVRHRYTVTYMVVSHNVVYYRNNGHHFILYVNNNDHTTTYTTLTFDSITSHSCLITVTFE